MPKIKTNRGAAKRFKRTSSGSFKRNASHRRHILTKKPTKRKRQSARPDHAGQVRCGRRTSHDAIRLTSTKRISKDAKNQTGSTSTRPS